MHRNQSAIQRIQDVPVEYPVRFVMLGDIRSAQDRRFLQLFAQINQLEPRPLFIVNIGDFAAPDSGPDAGQAYGRSSGITEYGPYLDLVDASDIPIVSVVGNHDIEDGFEKYNSYFGDENFSFKYGNAGFVAIHSAHGNPSRGIFGPREQDLKSLHDQLQNATRENKIVFMHIPPYLENEFYWKPGMAGFKDQEPRFRDTVEGHGVKMVASAHNQCFNRCARSGVEYVVSGGGGWEVPYWEDTDHESPRRGLFFHFVLVTIGESGEMTGDVIKINEGTRPDPHYRFTIA